MREAVFFGVTVRLPLDPIQSGTLRQLVNAGRLFEQRLQKPAAALLFSREERSTLVLGLAGLLGSFEALLDADRFAAAALDSKTRRS